jgi:serralysin
MIAGGSKADTLDGDDRCSKSGDDVFGDTLCLNGPGSPGRDVIHGGDGNDGLSGFSGDDQLYGGYGNDFLMGMAGRDRLDGGPGNDLFQGDDDQRLAAADVMLDGGPDIDVCRALPTNITVGCESVRPG